MLRNVDLLLDLPCVQELLDEYEHTLGTGNRKARKYMTKAIQNGDFDADFFANMQPASKRRF